MLIHHSSLAGIDMPPKDPIKENVEGGKSKVHQKLRILQTPQSWMPRVRQQLTMVLKISLIFVIVLEKISQF